MESQEPQYPNNFAQKNRGLLTWESLEKNASLHRNSGNSGLEEANIWVAAHHVLSLQQIQQLKQGPLV